MNTIATKDVHLKAEIYTDLINDMQGRIAEFELDNPEYMNDEIRNVNKQLSKARMTSRIKVDEEHFMEWEKLLTSAEAAMIRAKLFG